MKAVSIDYLILNERAEIVRIFTDEKRLTTFSWRAKSYWRTMCRLPRRSRTWETLSRRPASIRPLVR